MLLAAILSAWIQYAADGKPHARAIVSDRCPAIAVDGHKAPMEQRAGTAAGFGDVVCDHAVDVGARTIRVGGRALPAPAHDPRTIVVLGDTGCRIGILLDVQACDDPTKWPFPRTAHAIARVRPDLIVHVGDYLYREHACPFFGHCAGSPHGDDAPAWNADWFVPAAPMFATAPLVLVRGNHEECHRNGAGWFRYLEPHAMTPCRERMEPYAVDLGTLRIVAFDSAVAPDRRIDRERAPLYRREFARARNFARGPSWFATHRPPYLNDDERAAMGDSLAPFDAVLSGHLHLFAALNVVSLPPLVINGEGGAKLDPNYAPLLGFVLGGLRVRGKIFGTAQFGFGVYSRHGAGWTISLRDPSGVERARCTLVDRTVRC